MSKEHSLNKNSTSVTSFQDPLTGRFLKGKHWRPHAKFRDKNYLESEYTQKSRSAADIAKDFGVHENSILFWLDRHGIPRRTMSQIRQVKKWGAHGKNNPMYGRCGSKNPRWIDGSSPERQRMYARSFWKELSKTIFARDNYKCVRCGAPHVHTNRLHAHHVKTWAGNPDARFSLENIITVCQKCHNWIHSKQNKKYEFLSP